MLKTNSKFGYKNKVEKSRQTYNCRKFESPQLSKVFYNMETVWQNTCCRKLAKLNFIYLLSILYRLLIKLYVSDLELL